MLTWAGIAGDNVLLHAAAEAGVLGRMRVIFVDTLHLFDETLTLLEAAEKRYGFTALRALPEGCASKADWRRLYGSDLYMTGARPRARGRRHSAEPRIGGGGGPHAGGGGRGGVPD